jgi:hypothetical protein
MTADDKFRAIRDAIQHDPGNRGLARDPDANLFNACPDDLAAACRSITEHPSPVVGVVTGFWIPSARLGETDGPLGAVYLMRTLGEMGIPTFVLTDPFCAHSIHAGLRAAGVSQGASSVRVLSEEPLRHPPVSLTHLIALERVGPSHTPESIRAQPGTTELTVQSYLAEVPSGHHDRCHTMRGIDVSDKMMPAAWLFERPARPAVTIGVGDGGNEIGMGKIPWDVIRRNIPGGGRIACRVATDHLIVAGVSNWGAYALAAGVALLRNFSPSAEWFDVDRERGILTFMVEHGPLVDGVSGDLVPRVDGLSWEVYSTVLDRIGEIVRQ